MGLLFQIVQPSALNHYECFVSISTADTIATIDPICTLTSFKYIYAVESDISTFKQARAQYQYNNRICLNHGYSYHIFPEVFQYLKKIQPNVKTTWWLNTTPSMMNALDQKHTHQSKQSITAKPLLITELEYLHAHHAHENDLVICNNLYLYEAGQYQNKHVKRDNLEQPEALNSHLQKWLPSHQIIRTLRHDGYLVLCPHGTSI